MGLKWQKLNLQNTKLWFIYNNKYFLVLNKYTAIFILQINIEYKVNQA